LESVAISGTNPLIATYTVTDGSTLDEDGSLNGIIVDPVGLAVADSGLLANTGIDVRVPLIVGILLASAGLAAIRAKRST
jgi:hypothetical protein